MINLLWFITKNNNKIKIKDLVNEVTVRNEEMGFA